MTQRTTSSVQPSNHDTDDPFTATRMGFADHLDELRNCVIRALIGVTLASLLTLYFGREILELICRPLLVVQFANGLQPHIQVLSPSGAFSAYLQLGFLTGLILAMPWVMHQGWNFVASGLYPRERRFIKLMIPTSGLLFMLGVLFLYFIVLPIVLHFFVRFNEAFAMPSLAPSGFSRLLLPDHQWEPAADPAVSAAVPVLESDPTQPKNGDMWINATTRRLMVQTSGGVLIAPLLTSSADGSLQSQFALDQYVSFVLMLALGFGIAFESPIVVVFLAWSGLVPAATMAAGRRYVLLAIVVVAAVITPPDVLSQLLLAVPMYGLFEAGLVVARMVSRGDGGERPAKNAL